MCEEERTANGVGRLCVLRGSDGLGRMKMKQVIDVTIIKELYRGPVGGSEGSGMFGKRKRGWIMFDKRMRG